MHRNYFLVLSSWAISAVLNLFDIYIFFFAYPHFCFSFSTGSYYAFVYTKLVSNSQRSTLLCLLPKGMCHHSQLTPDLCWYWENLSITFPAHRRHTDQFQKFLDVFLLWCLNPFTFPSTLSHKLSGLTHIFRALLFLLHLLYMLNFCFMYVCFAYLDVCTTWLPDAYRG